MVSKDKPSQTKSDEPIEGEDALSCGECGAKIETVTKYCPRCGRLLRTDKEEPSEPRNIKKSLLYLGRDVGVAVLIVLIVLGAIFAYTRVWPPMVVVESSSMQHSNDVSYVGVIDTGDLVLVQSAPLRSDVITWVEGKVTGYMTYSNYGDVIIFNTDRSSTPIIHRAIFWMNYNATTKSFDIPDLVRLGLNALWGGFNANGSAVRSPRGLNGTIWLAQFGWRGDLNVTFNLRTSFLNYPARSHDGYVTFGDNNAYSMGGSYDPTPVLQESIIGKARGELPWFGLIKLTLAPSSNSCCHGWGDLSAPKNSWDSLLFTLLLIIISPIVIDISTTLLSKKKVGTEEGTEVENEGKKPASSGVKKKTVDQKEWKESHEEAAHSNDVEMEDQGGGKKK
jgi:signal peptidase